MLQKDTQDRELAQFKRDLDRMYEMEQKISSDWCEGVTQMEEKLLGMGELMNTTIAQLKENTRLLS